MKMLHIVDGPPLYTNCFLLIGKAGAAVAVDPAAEAGRFKAALAREGASLTHIFLTHGHHDHIGALEDLRRTSGAKVYIGQEDAKQFGIKADAFFTDGMEISVDDMAFRVYTTPGHTQGSVCILCGELLFTGDTLFAGDIGRTDFEGGSAAKMRESLRKLRTAVPGNPQILPGHEEFSTMDQEKAGNRYLCES